MLKIKFEMCNIYKAQCAEENSPLKCKYRTNSRDASTTQGLEVAWQNSSVKCKLRDFKIREYRCEIYVSYRFQLKFYRRL